MRGLYLLAAPSTPAEVIDAVAERSAEGERLSLSGVSLTCARVVPRINPSRRDNGETTA
jgi:hypothetical protein